MTKRALDAEGLLADLTEEQRDAVTTRASPLCVVAGAGSGKTLVLTRRIAWQAAEGYVDARNVMAFTFTRSAASELRRRVRALGLHDKLAAGTFHAIALAMLRRYWTDKNRLHPEILQHRVALLSKLHPRLDRRVLAALNTEIGWARARMITPDKYPDAAAAARRRTHRNTEFVAKVYASYNDAKKKRRLFDFDDMLALSHEILTEDAGFAAAQRWHRRHLLVDEFQDVNPLQFAVLRAWLGEESTLVVVGDPNQAIYSWNGAEPDLLNNIDRHLRGVAKIHLVTNFRSSPEILNAAARVLGIEPQRATRPSGDEPVVTEIHGYGSNSRNTRRARDTLGRGEAVTVARTIRVRRRPHELWRHQAVLARTSAQLDVIRGALESAGIPTRTHKPVSRIPEIPEILAQFDKTEKLASFKTDLASDTLRLATEDPTNDPTDQTADVFRREPVAEHTDTRDALLELTRGALLELAQGHLALEPTATVEHFKQSLWGDGAIAPTADGVELCTFHSSKGLQWPIVHLVGIEEGFVPFATARTASAKAEERRLLYVAATRAKNELHITWCRRRMLDGKVLERRPSPWLDAFVAGPPSFPAPIPKLEELRATLSASRDQDHPDPEVVEHQRLRECLIGWREQAARGASSSANQVLPEHVLSDPVIDMLVDLRPSSMAELADLNCLGPIRAARFGEPILNIISTNSSLKTTP